MATVDPTSPDLSSERAQLSIPSPSGASLLSSSPTAATNLAASALTSYVHNTLMNWRDERLQGFQPLSLFFKKERFALPKRNELSQRVRANLKYFQTNYLLLFGLLTILCSLTNLRFMVVSVVLGCGWLYFLRWRRQPLRFGKFEITKRMIFITLAIATFIVVYLAGIFMVLFWLLAISSVVILAHAALYIPERVDEIGFGLLDTVPQPTSLPTTSDQPKVDGSAQHHESTRASNGSLVGEIDTTSTTTVDSTTKLYPPTPTSPSTPKSTTT